MIWVMLIALLLYVSYFARFQFVRDAHKKIVFQAQGFWMAICLPVVLMVAQALQGMYWLAAVWLAVSLMFIRVYGKFRQNLNDHLMCPEVIRAKWRDKYFYDVQVNLPTAHPVMFHICKHGVLFEVALASCRISPQAPEVEK